VRRYISELEVMSMSTCAYSYENDHVGSVLLEAAKIAYSVHKKMYGILPGTNADTFSDAALGAWRAYRKWDAARTSQYSTLRAYLVRGAMRGIVDGYRNRQGASAEGTRRRGLKNTHSLDALLPTHTAYIAPEPAADETLDAAEARATIARALPKLPTRLQYVVQMYDLSGYTHKEIAALMGVTESRVCQMRTQALKQLRKHLTTGGTK
jgi:RNA polymerase sigma factor (sigma-70 family)